jgi:decaprenyl-phosphate phosphoribosyltransferase
VPKPDLILCNSKMTAKRISEMLRLLRPKQWIKNSFVLAPLLFTGQFLELNTVLQVLAATGLFCIASSASYIVNDLRDVERDRRHPTKSLRPLAAGHLTIKMALIQLVVLYLILLWGWYAFPWVSMVITIYLVLNLAYSFGLKHQPIIDIFVIAIGFVLRVWAGAMAIDVPVSGWMFVTTLCLALYLAAIKRGQELAQQGVKSREVLKQYSPALVNRYAEMSATCALIFYSLFVMSNKPALVVTVPLVLFGLFRYWFVVDALGAGESPTDALFEDRQLLATVIVWMATCLWALWPV